MKKSILIFCLLFSYSIIFAQAKNEKTKEYEYRVFSFGKTYFNSMDVDDPYYFILGSRTSFGDGLTEKLNILGRLGWELTEVVGAIGGDQEIILKREKGVLSAEKEAEVIEAIRKEQNEQTEAYFKQLEKQKKPDSPLIETDSRDWDIEYEKGQKAFEDEVKRLVDFAKTIDGVVDASYNGNVYNAILTIKCDFTKTELNGNEYSLQKIKVATNEIYTKIRYEVDLGKFSYSTHTIDLNLITSLTYEGKSYVVHSDSFKIERSYK